jgi:hypothetical protein
MYQRYVAGHGYQQLARWLDREGFTSTRGNGFSIMTVRRVLESGFAAGFVSVHDPACDAEREPRDNHTRTCAKRKLIEGAHEAIITADLWQRFQRAHERRSTLTPKARTARWHLGAGLTTCSTCGANMIANSLKPRDNKALAVCSWYLNGKNCSGTWMSRRDLDAIVDEWLGYHLEQWADAQNAGADDERAEVSLQLDDAKQDLHKLDEGRRLAARLVTLGDMTEEDHRRAVEDVEAKRRAVTDRIDALTAQLDALDPDGDVLDRLERNMITEPAELNTVLKRLLRRVVVSKNEVIVEPWHGDTWVYDRTAIPRRARTSWPERGADGKFAASHLSDRLSPHRSRV